MGAEKENFKNITPEYFFSKTREFFSDFFFYWLLCLATGFWKKECLLKTNIVLEHNRLDVIRWCKRKQIHIDAKRLAKLARKMGRIRIFEWVVSRYALSI